MKSVCGYQKYCIHRRCHIIYIHQNQPSRSSTTHSYHNNTNYSTKMGRLSIDGMAINANRPAKATHILVPVDDTQDSEEAVLWALTNVWKGKLSHSMRIVSRAPVAWPECCRNHIECTAVDWMVHCSTCAFETRSRILHREISHTQTRSFTSCTASPTPTPSSTSVPPLWLVPQLE